MAKTSKTVSFKNATINFDDMTITETNKDDFAEYDLEGVLRDWNGISGISLTLKTEDELTPLDEERENAD